MKECLRVAAALLLTACGHDSAAPDAEADGGEQGQEICQLADDGSCRESLPAGRIVYVSRRGGRDSLWTVRSDGRDAKQLTAGSATESGPRWSPDGQHIAFARSVAGRLQVFIVGEDGSGEQQLTDDDHDNYDPAWSALQEPSSRLTRARSAIAIPAGPRAVGNLCSNPIDRAWLKFIG